MRSRSGLSGSVGSASFNGMIVLDEFRLGFTIVFLIVSALTVLVSMVWVEGERLPAGEFHSLLMFATAGMMLMASGGDLVIIFLGLEILSIATYVMAGFRRTDVRSNESSLKYFILGSFSSAFLLYGIALIYGATATSVDAGTTNICRDCPAHSRRAVSPPAVRRRRDDAGRLWFQDCDRALSRLDAGRLRRRAHSGDGFHGGWTKSSRLCFVHARLHLCFPVRRGQRTPGRGGATARGLGDGTDGAGDRHHDGRQRGRRLSRTTSSACWRIHQLPTLATHWLALLRQVRQPTATSETPPSRP